MRCLQVCKNSLSTWSSPLIFFSDICSIRSNTECFVLFLQGEDAKSPFVHKFFHALRRYQLPSTVHYRASESKIAWITVLKSFDLSFLSIIIEKKKFISHTHAWKALIKQHWFDGAIPKRNFSWTDFILDLSPPNLNVWPCKKPSFTHVRCIWSITHNYLFPNFVVDSFKLEITWAPEFRTFHYFRSIRSLRETHQYFSWSLNYHLHY
jgi:hypothetical protein